MDILVWMLCCRFLPAFPESANQEVYLHSHDQYTLNGMSKILSLIGQQLVYSNFQGSDGPQTVQNRLFCTNSTFAFTVYWRSKVGFLYAHQLHGGVQCSWFWSSLTSASFLLVYSAWSFFILASSAVIDSSTCFILPTSTQESSVLPRCSRGKRKKLPTF